MLPQLAPTMANLPSLCNRDPYNSLHIQFILLILSALTSVFIVGMLQLHPPIVVCRILLSVVVIIAASSPHCHAETTFLNMTSALSCDGC